MSKMYRYKGKLLRGISPIGGSLANIVTDDGELIRSIDTADLVLEIDPCLDCCKKAEIIGRMTKQLHHLLFLSREGASASTLRKELEYGAEHDWKKLLLTL